MIRNDTGSDFYPGGGGSPYYNWWDRYLSPGDLGDKNDPNSRTAPPAAKGGGGVPTGATSAGPAAAGTTTGSQLGTLGGVSSVLAAAQKAAALLSGLSAGRADARNAAGVANQNQARAAADIFNTRMNAALKGPRMSAEDAVRGDTMANLQPFEFTGDTKMVGNIPVPQSRGGMNPSVLGPNSRAAGASLSQLGASRVNSHSFDLPDAPVLPDLPQAGTGDSVLNNAALIASLVSIFGPSVTSLLRTNSQTTGRPLPRTNLDDEDFNGIG